MGDTVQKRKNSHNPLIQASRMALFPFIFLYTYNPYLSKISLFPGGHFAPKWQAHQDNIGQLCSYLARVKVGVWSFLSYKSLRKNKTRQSSIDFYQKGMSILDFLANTTTLAHLSPDLLTNLETRTILGWVTSKEEISRKHLTSAPILKVTLSLIRMSYWYILQDYIYTCALLSRIWKKQRTSHKYQKES